MLSSTRGVTMNQQVLVVKQNLVTEARLPDEARWKEPQHHKPVARLTMVLTWRQPHHSVGGGGERRQAIKFYSLVTIGFLLVFTIVLTGTSYLSGLLVQRIQSLPHYNQPQAQYSNLWK